jgi:hypothetical protein
MGIESIGNGTAFPPGAMVHGLQRQKTMFHLFDPSAVAGAFFSLPLAYLARRWIEWKKSGNCGIFGSV